VNIIAIPDGDHGFILDCDECGPLGAVERTSLRSTANLHLATHGVITPTSPLCSCGYDWTRITGHALDHATCNTCPWDHRGVFADHEAVHHWLDTHHTWHLLMGDRP
jgi:hypothetical protein